MNRREEVVFAQAVVPYCPGDPFEGRYILEESKGEGPLGTTWRARTTEGVTVALKIVSDAMLPGTPERQGFVAEYRALLGRTMQRVACPMDVGLDKRGAAYVVTPWVEGTSLRALLRSYRRAARALSPAEVYGIFLGTVEAMRELHAVASHGALYPESIRLSDQVTLVDPGLAAILPQPLFGQTVVTYADVAAYIAPEVKAGRKANAGADLHALGALVAELVTGDPSAASGFSWPGAGDGVEAAVRGLVSPKLGPRAGSLPQLLDRFRAWLPAPELPAPVAVFRASTRPPPRPRLDDEPTHPRARIL
jgi:serine/threonine protein kinase